MQSAFPAHYAQARSVMQYRVSLHALSIWTREFDDALLPVAPCADNHCKLTDTAASLLEGTVGPCKHPNVDPTAIKAVEAKVVPKHRVGHAVCTALRDYPSLCPQWKLLRPSMLLDIAFQSCIIGCQKQWCGGPAQGVLEQLLRLCSRHPYIADRYRVLIKSRAHSTVAHPDVNAIVSVYVAADGEQLLLLDLCVDRLAGHEESLPEADERRRGEVCVDPRILWLKHCESRIPKGVPDDAHVFLSCRERHIHPCMHANHLERQHCLNLRRGKPPVETGGR
mmetsp:Transcript_34503/g.72618  ORF Transcript_34503/g.72618 Transcript_34503/m.72618 type:complete len:280 (-) Transcript_34503:285-1124(-)